LQSAASTGSGRREAGVMSKELNQRLQLTNRYVVNCHSKEVNGCN
jgi:hypothetical protein